MPNKAVAELDRLHDRTVNPVFASYEHTSEAIRAKCRHTTDDSTTIIYPLESVSSASTPR